MAKELYIIVEAETAEMLQDKVNISIETFTKKNRYTSINYLQLTVTNNKYIQTLLIKAKCGSLDNITQS
jgi:hypothetical protein